jgi:hypothetical protein
VATCLYLRSSLMFKRMYLRPATGCGTRRFIAVPPENLIRDDARVGVW